MPCMCKGKWNITTGVMHPHMICRPRKKYRWQSFLPAGCSWAHVPKAVLFELGTIAQMS